MQILCFRYMKIIEAFKPDVYEVISDSDTNVASSQKRCRKSVEVSCGMFDACMEKHKSSKVCFSPAIFYLVLL